MKWNKKTSYLFVENWPLSELKCVQNREKWTINVLFVFFYLPRKIFLVLFVRMMEFTESTDVPGEDKDAKCSNFWNLCLTIDGY